MKYICKDCNKVYEEKPDFCECGNDSFTEENTYDDQENENEETEQKGNFLPTLLTCVLVIAVVCLIVANSLAHKKYSKADNEYFAKIKQTLLQDFNTSKIQESGVCVVSFEITPEGNIINKKLEHESTV